MTDFGLSTTATVGADQTPAIGTARYTAPEMGQIGSVWTRQCDVYSFGLLLYEIFHEKLAFHGLDALQATSAASAISVWTAAHLLLALYLTCAW